MLELVPQKAVIIPDSFKIFYDCCVIITIPSTQQ